MKRILLLLICICLVFVTIPNVWAQSSIVILDPHMLNWLKLSVSSIMRIPFNFYVPENANTLPKAIDPHLLNWIKSNVSPVTGLPYSFYISEKDKAEIYRQMGPAGSQEASIERIITHEGMDIYDGAVYQIVLGMAGGEANFKQASLPDRYYWDGAVGDSWNIRAGFPINNFIYDPKDPESVSSDVSRLGQRGFIFRILDADGQFLVTDPLDGKKTLAGFPGGDRLHWVDWKPVAGENAWVVIAALQLYVRHPDSIELNLAQELARAAMKLQSDCGGIRMAPLGTYGDFYERISTENNISWYAALRMLFQITGDEKYKKAMDGIEGYLRFVWNEKEGYFYQGATELNGQWKISSENFALDVQTWGIACIGPRHLDALLGEGSAWRIWQAGRGHSGVFDGQGRLLGVGFTDEHDRISVEWSAGAMVALAELSKYYKDKNSTWVSKAMADKSSMRMSMESLHYNISQSLAAYSYSSRRGKIPFGWNSHDPRVMSLASSGWMIFVDAGINPFWLV